MSEYFEQDPVIVPAPLITGWGLFVDRYGQYPMAGPIRLQKGPVHEPGLTFARDERTGIQSNGEGEIGLTCIGFQKIYVDIDEVKFLDKKGQVLFRHSGSGIQIKSTQTTEIDVNVFTQILELNPFSHVQVNLLIQGTGSVILDWNGTDLAFVGSSSVNFVLSSTPSSGEVAFREDGGYLEINNNTTNPVNICMIEILSI